MILEQGPKGMEVSKPCHYLVEKYCRWEDQLQRPLRKEQVWQLVKVVRHELKKADRGQTLTGLVDHFKNLTFYLQQEATWGVLTLMFFKGVTYTLVEAQRMQREEWQGGKQGNQWETTAVVHIRYDSLALDGSKNHKSTRKKQKHTEFYFKPQNTEGLAKIYKRTENLTWLTKTQSKIKLFPFLIICLKRYKGNLQLWFSNNGTNSEMAISVSHIQKSVTVLSMISRLKYQEDK